MRLHPPHHYVLPFLSRVAYRVGFVCARRPIRVLSLALLFTLLCAVGFVKFRFERDLFSSTVPRDTQQYKDLEAYRAVGYGELPRSLLAWLISALDDLPGEKGSTSFALDGGNGQGASGPHGGMLNLTQALLLQQELEAKIVALQVRSKNVPYSMDDVCYRVPKVGEVGACVLQSPLNVYGVPPGEPTRQRLLQDPDPLATLSNTSLRYDYTVTPISLSTLLAGVERNATTDRIVRLTGLRSYLLLDHGQRGGVAAARKFAEVVEGTILQDMRPKFRAAGFRVNIIGTDLLSRDILLTGILGLPLIIGVVVAMAGLIVLTIGKHPFDPLRSRALVGLFGLGFVPLALAPGVCLMLVAGIPISSFTMSAVFITIAVGVDDIFVLVDHYDTTRERYMARWRADAVAAAAQMEPLPPRPAPAVIIADTMSSAGSAIIFTSLTDVAALVSSAASTIQVQVDTSVVIAVALSTLCLLVLTAGPALLALDARREDSGLVVFKPWTWCGATRKSKGNRTASGLPAAEGDAVSQSAAVVQDMVAMDYTAASQPATYETRTPSHSVSAADVVGMGPSAETSAHAGDEGLTPSVKDFAVSAFAESRDWQDYVVDRYTHAILSLPGKAIILLCAIGLVVVGATQAPQSRTGYSLRLLVSTGESLKYLNRASDVYGGLQQDASLVFEGFDLRQDAHADAAEATYAAVVASQPFNKQPDTHFFFLPAFRAWAASNAIVSCAAYQSLPQVNVVDCVKGFLAQNITGASCQIRWCTPIRATLLP